LEDWWPGGPYRPRITRFDNPFADSPFPLDALPLDAHWGEVGRIPTHVRADWLIWPSPCQPQTRRWPAETPVTASHI